MVRVDEMGRIYHDLGVGEDGKQLSTINITLFGRRLLLSGDIYNQACNEVVSIVDAITYRSLIRKIYEPITLTITKPIELVKYPFDAENILVTPNAYNNLLRTFGAESVLVTPTALPSLLKLLIETITVAPTAYKAIIRHINDTISVAPNIFRTWLSTKMLTQSTYVTATAYKQPTHKLSETITLTDIIAYGFYIFCNVVVGIACAMGNRNITHKLVESADMINEQMKALVRIVEDEVVHILPTAYKQPQKAITLMIAVNDYLIKQPLKTLTDAVVSVVDSIKFGTSQYCAEAISVVAALQPFQIIKSCVETATVTATKTVSLIRTIIQNTIITPVFHITKNIFQYLTQTIVVTPFINGLYTKLLMHTAVKTVREVISKDTVAEIKSATVTKVLHAGTQIDSMKSAAITRLKSVTGVYKEGDEQR